MKDPEFDAAFRAITENVDFDQHDELIERPTTLIDASPAVEATMDYFLSLIQKHGNIDMNDSAARYELIVLLTQCMNAFFKTFEGLSYKDETIVEGGTVITTLDEVDNSIEATYLDPESEIYGRVVGLYIGSIPDESALVYAQEDVEEDDDRPFGVTPFGLCLMVDEAVISDGKGVAETIPDEMITCIPLNYSFLKLKKVT